MKREVQCVAALFRGQIRSFTYSLNYLLTPTVFLAYLVQRRREKGQLLPDKESGAQRRWTIFLGFRSAGCCGVPPLHEGINRRGEHYCTEGGKRLVLGQLVPLPSGELGRAVGPRGAWGEGAPDFLPEASWKPAALRAPGASSAGVGPSMEPEARGEGAPGAQYCLGSAGSRASVTWRRS